MMSFAKDVSYLSCCIASHMVEKRIGLQLTLWTLSGYKKEKQKVTGYNFIQIQIQIFRESSYDCGCFKAGLVCTCPAT